MQGLQSILSFFHSEFNKFNNTGAPMYLLNLILYVLANNFSVMSGWGSTNVKFFLSHDIKFLKNHIFDVKTSKFCHLFSNIIMDIIMLRFLSVNHYWFINFIAWPNITGRHNIM